MNIVCRILKKIVIITEDDKLIQKRMTFYFLKLLSDSDTVNYLSTNLVTLLGTSHYLMIRVFQFAIVDPTDDCAEDRLCHLEEITNTT